MHKSVHSYTYLRLFYRFTTQDANGLDWKRQKTWDFTCQTDVNCLIMRKLQTRKLLTKNCYLWMKILLHYRQFLVYPSDKCLKLFVCIC